jgi:hypothetical protein
VRLASPAICPGQATTRPSVLRWTSLAQSTGSPPRHRASSMWLLFQAFRQQFRLRAASNGLSAGCRKPLNSPQRLPRSWFTLLPICPSWRPAAPRCFPWRTPRRGRFCSPQRPPNSCEICPAFPCRLPRTAGLCELLWRFSEAAPSRSSDEEALSRFIQLNGLEMRRLEQPSDPAPTQQPSDPAPAQQQPTLPRSSNQPTLLRSSSQPTLLRKRCRPRLIAVRPLCRMRWSRIR